MDPLRVRVAPLGKGYLAESTLAIAAGASAEEAVERARLMAIGVLDILGESCYPDALIVRIDEVRQSAIAMQSMHEPFSLDAAGKAYGTCYFDSAGNATAPSDR